MKIFLRAILTTWLYLLVGCSAPAHLEKDKSIDLSADYKTYMWVETKSNENDVSKRGTSNADVSVHNAVNNEIDDWKWKPTSASPDIYISYDVFVENSTASGATSTSMTRYYYDTQQQKWIPISYPSSLNGYQLYETPVEEGTFVLTMTDAKTGKTIWQGWTTEKLHGSGITNLDAVKSVRRIFRAD